MQEHIRDQCLCFPLADSAVLAGSLTWVKLDSENRTTAQFSLTLSLSHSQYPSSEVGDRVYVTGSVVEYGDGETTGDGPLAMKVVLKTPRIYPYTFVPVAP